MSTALHSAPHQTTTLTTPPVSSSSRHYHSPIVETSSAQQSSPSSRRPPSRKTSGNAPDAGAQATNRAGMPYHSSTQSPQADRAVAMAPTAPPRTSSTQQTSGSRRNQYSSERVSQSPRRGGPADSSRTGSRGDANGTMDGGHRSRRGASTHMSPDTSMRSPESSRAGHTSMPIRTPQPAPKSSREAHDNLNRVISNNEDPNSRDPRAKSQNMAQDDAAPPPVVGTGDERRAGRSRQDYSSKQQKGTAKFGDFILGNTIGEGEFGKVKLGWKQDDSRQVAIKLIKRDTVGSNPSRLAKIMREVTILREVKHANIVALIDMVETDRYMGIVLEYASGGELFDYILNHRYLKDQSARRLFAQLVSGVGYLHKKGIVHRDLKLENLLLDRHRNIIITDFGFANTFNANEELHEEEELNLSDRDFVKRMGLDKVKSDGTRKGDLMQTSCGSPCYAAPELVVSDSLYTGRKVDVWSCGVILYAMLAGYLPFDDDPANPEGDNINLLYKYIVTTPLTFPEYVTPHARDLLRRILVPNPRKRADLFEVARHSWLSEYAHVVEFITSSTTLPADVQNATNAQDEYSDGQGVARSSSVRESHKTKSPTAPSVGGLAKATGKIDGEPETQRTPKDAKRRTVQVEYVAPTTQTQRGAEETTPRSAGMSGSRGRGDYSPQEKPLPRDPPTDAGRPSTNSRRQPNAGPKGVRDPRTTTENAYIPDSTSHTRPRTGGSLSSAASMGMHYGQPAPPTLADTNAEGRMAQRTNGNEQEPMGRPSISAPNKFAQISGMDENEGGKGKGHKRSSTLDRLLGRSGSVFGGKKKQQQSKDSRKYPPVSMSNTMAGEEPGRPSVDSKMSRKSFSLGLGKKQSGSMTGSQGSGEKSDRRRFSLLPPSFSKAIGLGKETNGNPPSETDSQTQLPLQQSRAEHTRSVTAHGDARGSSPFFDPSYHNAPQQAGNPGPRHQRYASAQLDGRRPNAIPPYLQQSPPLNTGSDPEVDSRRQPNEPFSGYQQPYHQSEGHDGQRVGTLRSNRGALQKGHKNFSDAYEQDKSHEGSSGAARRVMDFFRRRGKARGGEDSR